MANWKIRKRKKFVTKMLRKHKRKVWRLRSHPFLIPVSTFIVLFFVTSAGLVLMNGRTVATDDTHIVVFTVDGKQQTLPTRAQTVDDLLKRVNVTLQPGDIVEPAKETPISGDYFRVNLYHAVPITIIDNGKKITATSAYKEPREIVQKSGLSVFPEDSVVAQPSDEFLKEGVLGEKIVIERSTLVNLNLYGAAYPVRTRAKTVAALLKEKNAVIEGNNVLPADLNTPITENMQVFVVSPGKQLESREEIVPIPSEVVKDNTLSAGTTAVRQQGSAGRKVVTYEIDIKTASRKVIQEIVTVEPVKQVIAKGTRSIVLSGSKGDWAAAAGVAPEDYLYVDYIISHESGWCPSKWQGQVGYCPGYYTELHDPTSSYGYGLCQATPAGKMATAGSDWQTNPVTQLKWCAGYAQGRYGGWSGAYDHWQNYHSW